MKNEKKNHFEVEYPFNINSMVVFIFIEHISNTYTRIM